MSVDLQPVLTDSAVELRPIAEADRAALYAAASDPLIWAGHPAHDRWTRRSFDAFFDDSLASGGGLVARDPATARVIGHSRFDTARAGPGEVEIGWTFLIRDHWGGATNRSCKRLMIGHALKGFERVIFLVGEDNVRSRRALEKIGARLTPRVTETVLAGRPVRHVVYAIDRNDFARGPLMR